MTTMATTDLTVALTESEADELRGFAAHHGASLPQMAEAIVRWYVKERMQWYDPADLTEINEAVDQTLSMGTPPSAGASG